MSALELSDVRHRYPGAPEPTLRTVSLSVADGAMVSVVGPSGSGKSTLLRVAAGLEPATGGRVLLGGLDVGHLPTERRDLTMMFQSPHLFDHLDVGGNVAFAPRLAGMGRREARRCARRYLRLVQLEGYERRAVDALSGGQQQRVALARALAAERSVLLLDEPFASLDRELRAAMHELLHEVRSAVEPTILLVTHDLDEAGLAESTVVLIDGLVHQHAPMTEIFRRPATLETARLLGGFTEIAGSVEHGVHRSAWGAVPLAEHCRVTGAAVACVRREGLRLVRELDTATRGPGVAATVTRRRTAGTRVIATLSGDAGATVEVELPIGQDVAPGARVRVELEDPYAGVWAVPADCADAEYDGEPDDPGRSAAGPTRTNQPATNPQPPPAGSQR